MKGTDHNLIAIHESIVEIKKILRQLETLGKDFPAIKQNSKRALASLKMMELNISDVFEFDLREL
ncbi:MAG: hypothetical protein GY729_15725 [Desulfobacteraceae bacterium]|nr:hypothetical protein [Desulfobacteraceae bacterium]